MAEDPKASAVGEKDVLLETILTGPGGCIFVYGRRLHCCIGARFARRLDHRGNRGLFGRKLHDY
jgi:hypothetical protein